MKRIVLSFAMVFSLLLSPTPFASAVTEGCPDTWKIDTTSRAGYDELVQAKNRLGSDLALGQPVTQYLNYAGESGALAAPMDRSALTREDIYLYGKTQVQWKIDVQVKNCPGKTSFMINLGTLSDSLNIKSISTNVDPQAWANANESSFVDFTKAAQFGACIKSIQKIISPPNLMAQLEGSLLVINPSGALRQRTFNDPCGVFKINPQRYFIYQDLSPKCRYFSEQSDRSTAIRKGSACEVAIALPTRDGLVVFTKFTIKAKDYKVKVTCVKGNLTKKFTTYQGYEFRVKCPTGYTKK